MRIVVTGADGFVGKELCKFLRSQQHEICAIGRRGESGGPPLTDVASWTERLRRADTVIHLAARAHIVHDRSSDSLQAFREVNVEGTRCLATAAVEGKVRRFVFVSSIGVFGNESGSEIFRENTAAAPVEPYAVSKWEAEQLLIEIGRRSNLEIVVIRPPLVYGPHVKGNFVRLLRLIASGTPLPFGSLNNQRSYIGLQNFCELLALSAVHPAAAGRVFVGADGQDISTPDLLVMLAGAMGKRARLFPCPIPVVAAVMSAVGKGAEFRRLAGNLRVDASYTRNTLGWHPSRSLHDGMVDMVRAYLGATGR